MPGKEGEPAGIFGFVARETKWVGKISKRELPWIGYAVKRELSVSGQAEPPRTDPE